LSSEVSADYGAGELIKIRCRRDIGSFKMVVIVVLFSLNLACQKNVI